ncbi:hypothetical protein AMECASPLE_019223 [Ameca splendens]|uniref:Uncharacterized protein n=1 Tax=Ameca splendens TaxID=208324 RepID=A0ABV0XFY8_9TELE
MEAKRSHTKAALAFSTASSLIGVFAVLDACLSPVTRQHCHGDQGLSNHLCNDPYSLEGRRGGGWNENRAGTGREEEEEVEEEEEGSSSAKQQGPRQRKRKQIFFLEAAEKEAFLILYNKQEEKLKDRESFIQTGFQNQMSLMLLSSPQQN